MNEENPRYGFYVEWGHLDESQEFFKIVMLFRRKVKLSTLQEVLITTLMVATNATTSSASEQLQELWQHPLSSSRRDWS